MEHDLAEEGVIASEDLVGVGEGIHGSKKGPVEPAASLKNEVRHFFWDIGFAGRALDVLQDPGAVALGDKLEAEDTIFSEIHVGCEDTSVGAVHLLARKVPLERSVAGLVVLKCDISVRGEGTWQYGDEAECRLQRLVQDIAHLVLKILSRNERVEELFAVLQHGLDLTTGTCAHRLDIESLPQLVDRIAARLCSSIDEHTDIGFQYSAEGLEEPSVGVDLLLILLLQAEEHLDWSIAALDLDNAFLDFEIHLRGVLVDMCCHVLAVDLLLGDTILIDTHRSQYSSGSGIDLGTTVADDAYDNLLPRFFAPSFAVCP